MQIITELLIWTRTSSLAMSNPSFVEVLGHLQSACLSAGTKGDMNDKHIIECIHRMQTCIQRFHQELNAAAHDKGFSLYSLFLMDPVTITLSMARHGKEGNTAMLQKLATKMRDNHILMQISKRYEDPKKAIPIPSIITLSCNWVPLLKEDEETDDIHKLVLAIQNASVCAAIEFLKGKVEIEKGAKGGATILASLDGTSVNDATAIIIAVAMNPQFSFDDQSLDGMETDAEKGGKASSIRLFIGTENECQANSLGEVIGQLDLIFKNASSASFLLILLQMKKSAFQKRAQRMCKT